MLCAIQFSFHLVQMYSVRFRRSVQWSRQAMGVPSPGNGTYRERLA